MSSGPFSYFFLDDNARNMENYSRSIGFFFIEDFIFLVKKIFLTKFQKLASERNFDLHPNKAIFPFFCLGDKKKVR